MHSRLLLHPGAPSVVYRGHAVHRRGRDARATKSEAKSSSYRPVRARRYTCWMHAAGWSGFPANYED